ncbi:hypothetical protein C7256_03180 [Enterocloster lavalensis]|nr:hypothetical protein C7256_03180 [Enterocloster lavalensis]
MQPFVRGGGTGWEIPSSAVGESKAQGDGKDGHRSELQRRPDAGPSASALLRALRALRNPAFPAPLDLRLSKPLHSHLPPCSPASHPLRVLFFLRLISHILRGETPAQDSTRNVSLLFLIIIWTKKFLDRAASSSAALSGNFQKEHFINLRSEHSTNTTQPPAALLSATPGEEVEGVLSTPSG